MEKVIEVKPLSHYSIRVTFSNGYMADIDIKPFIRGGISDRLKDEAFFKTVKLDNMSGICWDNGFDFSADTLWGIAQKEVKKFA